MLHKLRRSLSAVLRSKVSSGRITKLDAKVEFLQDEVSQLRTLMRHLVAQQKLELPHVAQTKESFDYQWREIPEGEAMLSNEAWWAGVEDTITKLSALPREWFQGKRVLDAGCGRGRWTYGFGKLGVGNCLSVDQSAAGLERTAALGKAFGDGFVVEPKNLLEDLGFEPDFDLVWCFGVLHHTGDTYKGFQNLVKCVKPGGYLFLMIYGEPRPGHIEDYLYYHEMFEMRCRLRNLNFDEKVQVLREKYGKDQMHGYFDAISPDINDLYCWDELESWLISAGFEDIQCTYPEHPNHHLVARKRES